MTARRLARRLRKVHYFQAQEPKMTCCNEMDECIAEAVVLRLAPLLTKFTEMASAQPPDYLSIKQAATLGDLSYDHVKRAVESGELPAANKGNGKKRVFRISRPDFDRWMQKNKGGKDLPPRKDLKEKVSRYLPGVD